MGDNTKIDILAVIGSGIVKSKRSNFGYEPSSIGKLRASAAYYLYIQGRVKKILFTGGHNLGIKAPSVARVMAEFLTWKFKAPKEVIQLDENTMDTVSAIEHLLIYRNKHHGQTIGLLTSDFHLKRTMLAAKLLGLKAEPFSAEKVLLDIPEEKIKASKFLSSPVQTFEVRREEKLIKMLPERIKSRQPNRILNEKGELKEFLNF